MTEAATSTRGRSLSAVGLAPVLAYALGWVLDNAIAALRAHRFGVPTFGVSGLPHPVLGIHLSLVGTAAAAVIAVAVAVRLARSHRPVVALAATLLVLVPSFGTLRDAARWARAPRTRAFSLVPARRVVPQTAGAVEIEGRFFELDHAHAVAIEDARMLAEGGGIVLQFGPEHAADVARLSWESVKAVGENNGRGFVALVVARRPVAAATFGFVATAARLAWPGDGIAAMLAQ